MPAGALPEMARLFAEHLSGRIAQVRREGKHESSRATIGEPTSTQFDGGIHDAVTRHSRAAHWLPVTSVGVA